MSPRCFPSWSSPDKFPNFCNRSQCSCTECSEFVEDENRNKWRNELVISFIETHVQSSDIKYITTINICVGTVLVKNQRLQLAVIYKTRCTLFSEMAPFLPRTHMHARTHTRTRSSFFFLFHRTPRESSFTPGLSVEIWRPMHAFLLYIFLIPLGRFPCNV